VPAPEITPTEEAAYLRELLERTEIISPTNLPSSPIRYTIEGEFTVATPQELPPADDKPTNETE
jgi:hypothetical protein